MLEYAWLLVAIPLVSGLSLLVWGKEGDRIGHLIGTAASTASFVVGVGAFIELLARPVDDRSFSKSLFTWISAGPFHVEMAYTFDQLSALFVLLITGVGTLIHVYSIGYMEHDARRRRFFAYLNIFIAAMLTLVLASDYLVLFLGWEGVGLASYLLIGFWQHKDSAAQAATKAFVINRVGDIGMALAIMVAFAQFGTSVIAEVNLAASSASTGVVTTLGLLLLLGACGKSAQVPLQAWLLDAMEGPTPVSALIHAATMVTAGVYLVVRSNGVFDASETARAAVVIVGLVTLLAGAWIGCTKDDIKKALAGSTMSQIGYMMLAAGLGPAGYAFAIFHLITHGFFKANMFLGAGSVMHGMDDDVDMRHYGALRAAMPVTFVTFALGYLAIIGVPPFAGFWSKDKIIEAALAQSWWAGLGALIGAGVTAFYMTRLLAMTFFGEKRWLDGVHPHESPKVMTLPLVALAGLSAFGGVLAFGGWITDWLAPVVGESHEHHLPAPAWVISLVVLAVVAIGVTLGFRQYGSRPVAQVAPDDREVSVFTRIGRNELYGNAFNNKVAVRPTRHTIRTLVYVDGAGLDAFVTGVADRLGETADALRKLQTGLVRSYALSMVGGALVLLVALLAVMFGMILTILAATPLLGAFVLAVMPRGSERLVKSTAVAFSLVALLISLGMLSRYDLGAAGFQLAETHTWIKPFGAYYALGIDGIGVTLILLTTVLTPIVLLAAWDDVLPDGRTFNGYLAWMLALEGLAIGVFAATDAFLFYLLFEATLVPIYFLIGSYGSGSRTYAAVKFLIYNLVGGLLMLASIVGLYVVSGREGAPSYLLSDLAGLDLGPGAEKMLFLGFMAAFAIKAPLFPFHTWLPDAATSATPSTAVLMVSVIDKVGTFGMLRWCLGLFPGAAEWATPAVVTLAVISVVYGALLAIGQDDLRRLVAFTSVSHFGFIILGLFAVTSTSTAGATLYMFNHGLSTAALFIVTGIMIARRGSASIADFGGVQKVAPLLAGLLLVSGLSSLSLPGLAPFVSEFMVFAGTFTRYPVAAIVSVVAIVLAALYILVMYQRTMTGPLREDNAGIGDLKPVEMASLAPAVVLMIGLGFFPQPLLNVINPAVDATLAHIGVGDPPPQTPKRLANSDHHGSAHEGSHE